MYFRLERMYSAQPSTNIPTRSTCYNANKYDHLTHLTLGVKQKIMRFATDRVCRAVFAVTKIKEQRWFRARRSRRLYIVYIVFFVDLELL